MSKSLSIWLPVLVFVASCGIPAVASANRTTLAFQGFETNSLASSVEDELAVGVLNNGQQLLELVDSDETFFSTAVPEGSTIRDFVQPSETFNAIDPLAPLPEQPTGRVFDASNGSTPWTLRWANTRVPPGLFDDLVQEQEDLTNAQLAQFGFPPIDLVFVGDPDETIPGPVPSEENFAGVVLNVTNSAFIDLNLGGGANGVTADNFDAFGVANQARFDSEPGFNNAAVIPSGEQALYIEDSDGAILLDLAPIDVSGYDNLLLSFELALADTGYEGFDRFAVLVNDQPVVDLFDSGDPDADNPLEPGTQEFRRFDVDLSAFDQELKLDVRFVFDSTSGAELFGLDHILVSGIEEGAGLTGDFNGDGAVNAADYTVWRDMLNQQVPVGTGPDANSDGLVDSADYTLWAANYGALSASGNPTASIIPEPAGFGLAIGLVVVTLRKRKR